MRALSEERLTASFKTRSNKTLEILRQHTARFEGPCEVRCATVPLHI